MDREFVINLLGETIDYLDSSLYSAVDTLEFSLERLREQVGSVMESMELTKIPNDFLQFLQNDYNNLNDIYTNCKEYVDNFVENYIDVLMEDGYFIIDSLQTNVECCEEPLMYVNCILESDGAVLIDEIKEFNAKGRKAFMEACEDVWDLGIPVDYDIYGGVTYSRNVLGAEDKALVDTANGYFDNEDNKVYFTYTCLKCNCFEYCKATMYHEICHYLCCKYFKDRECYCDNSIIFASLICFLNKKLGLLKNPNKIRMNKNYQCDFKNNYADIYKKVTDGRTTKRTFISYMRNLIDDIEDLRISKGDE